MSKRLISSVLVLSLAALCQAGRLEDRWAKSVQWEEAVAAAQKADKPIVILYGFPGGSSLAHDGVMDRFMAERSFESCVRVLNYVRDTNGPARKYSGLADRTNNLVPEVYIIEPKSLRLVGFVDYTNHEHTPAIAKVAIGAVRWRAKSDKTIEKSDRAAEQGRFKSALRDLEKIVEEDAAVSYRIERVLGVKYDPDRQPTEATDPHADTRNRGTKGEDPRKKSEAASEEDAKGEETPKDARGTFFPDLLQKKRSDYGEYADKRIAEARASMEKKDFAKARAAIIPMINDGSDLPQIEAAKTLLEEINAAAKAK
jgi:hypothetical protein